MRLYEYEAKGLLARSGIPVPDEKLVRPGEDARPVLDTCSFPVVLKAQVLTGGRGKAGGILNDLGIEPVDEPKVQSEG